MNDQPDWSEHQVANPGFDHLFQPDKPFFQTVYSQLSARLGKMGVPPCDRDDLIEKALLKIVKHRHQFAGEELERRVRCWLMKAVHRLALDYKRGLSNQFCEALDVGIAELIDEGEAKRAAMAEWSEQVMAKLVQVDPGNETSARMLLGHFLQRYSIPELAQQFDMTEDAVKGRIGRVLKKLRELGKDSLSS